MFLPLALMLFAPAADPDGFTPLFNGSDLAGWTAFAKPGPDGSPGDPAGTWAVADGVLKCSGKPHGYLASVTEYGDYRLRVKWRFPAGAGGGNSGVLLHCGPKDEVWPVSLEAQMRAGRAGDIWLNTPPATTLEVPPARRDPKAVRRVFRLADPPEKPFGEWNEYDITCRGGDVTLVVNGVLCNDGKNGNLRRGRIGLQSEGSPVEFRDVAIQRLK